MLQLFSADTKTFFFNLNFFIWPQTVKKTPSKVDQKYSIFSPIAAKTAQSEEFMFQNVAYRPTVYKNGG